ncbi:hypothetical protein ACH3XW_24190 [Acanthocheilonema viteae]
MQSKLSGSIGSVLHPVPWQKNNCCYENCQNICLLSNSSIRKCKRDIIIKYRYTISIKLPYELHQYVCATSTYH